MSTIIQFHCPACNSGLDSLEPILMTHWPFFHWRCKNCGEFFSIDHPATRAVIQRHLHPGHKIPITTAVNTGVMV